MWRGPEYVTVAQKLFWTEGIWVLEIPYLPKSRAFQRTQKNLVVITPLPGSNQGRLTHHQKWEDSTPDLNRHGDKTLSPFYGPFIYPKNHLFSHKCPSVFAPVPIKMVYKPQILIAPLSHIFLWNSQLYIRRYMHKNLSFLGASLVARWLRIRLPMQGTRVWALVWEDPTCCGATKPVRHNYWACVP